MARRARWPFLHYFVLPGEAHKAVPRKRGKIEIFPPLETRIARIAPVRSFRSFPPSLPPSAPVAGHSTSTFTRRFARKWPAFSFSTDWGYETSSRKWNRGRNGLHQLGQPVAPSIATYTPGQRFISPVCIPQKMCTN